MQAERDAANEGLASIRKLDLSGESGKGWKANVAMQGAALEMFTASMADVFKDKGGPNYVEASLRDVRDGTVYFCIVGPKRGKTPHELRQAAESEIATLRETLVGEVEARLHEKRMSFEMSGPHEDVDYRATFSFDEGGSWVRWPEIAAILNAIKGTP